MKYNELNDELVRNFPALKQVAISEMDTFECYQPGPHVLYGKVLAPYVKKLLKDETDFSELQKAFCFFEKLANSEDQEVKALLQVSLLEALWNEKDTYDKSKKYMRPITKQINNLIGSYLKIPTT